MFDWNGNGKIDPLDIGLSIAMDSQDSLDMIDLMGYPFRFVAEIKPDRNINGKFRQYLPHVLYEKQLTSNLHQYGLGPFCNFTVSKDWQGLSGVYALCDTRGLLYIGQCIDLVQRFNAGYGNISPRNCYKGGQSTNCKINAMILKKYLGGDKVYLYFYNTNDYDRVEHKLINSFRPLYNGQV